MIFMALFIMKRCHRDRNCGGSAAMKIHSFINTDILKEAKRYHGKPRSTLSSPWHFPGLRTVSRFRIHADLIDCGEISSLGTILSARISECDSAKWKRRKILWTWAQSVRLPFFSLFFLLQKEERTDQFGWMWIETDAGFINLLVHFTLSSVDGKSDFMHISSLMESNQMLRACRPESINWNTLQWIIIIKSN